MRPVLVFAVFFAAAIATAAPARAQPQIVAALPSGGPLPLACDARGCGADVSSVCLEKNRPAPVPATPYALDAADRESVRVVVEDRAGHRHAIDPMRLVIRSLRAQVAMHVYLAAADLPAAGLARAWIEIIRPAVLVPLGDTARPSPESAPQLARARAEIGAVAADWRTLAGNHIVQARIANRLMNRLPPTGTVSESAGETLWHAATADEDATPADVLAAARGLFQHCRAKAEIGGSMSARTCLGAVHDQYVREINFRYWRALEPGS